METVRIVTYNILSSHLAQPDHFKHCEPRDLQPETRLCRIQHKLEAEMCHHAVICLQEISQWWAGSLHAFFQPRQYHFVTALYGGPWTGYMGVGLAWPTEVYDATQVVIQRLADARRWPSSPPSNALVQAARQAATVVTGVWHQGLRLLGVKTEEPFDPWAVAQGRSNALIFVRLCPHQARSPFGVATYHMPCLYGSAKKRQTMLLHSSLAAQLTQELAGDDPYVLAGDFNVMPGSSSYRLLTEGHCAVEHEDFPTPRPDDDTGWDANDVKPLRSAYRVKTGREPDFTNHTRVGDEPMFTETLDYLFLSPHWSVEEVVKLPSRADLEGPFPNAQEPSDHVLIGAQLNLGNR